MVVTYFPEHLHVTWQVKITPAVNETDNKPTTNKYSKPNNYLNVWLPSKGSALMAGSIGNVSPSIVILNSYIYMYLLYVSILIRIICFITIIITLD